MFFDEFFVGLYGIFLIRIGCLVYYYGLCCLLIIFFLFGLFLLNGYEDELENWGVCGNYGYNYFYFFCFYMFVLNNDDCDDICLY